MKFLHLTDLHYLIEYPKVDTGYHSIFKNMTPPMEQLKKGLQQVGEFDAVLISGDLVEDGKKEDYIALKEELYQIFGNTPIIVTPGNHDIKPAFYEGWLEISASLEPYHHCVTVNDTTVIAFDNSQAGYPNGLIDLKRCEWLAKTLDECQSKHIILMMHHHLIEDQFDLPCAAYDETFYQLIKDSRIDVILCGHTHHAYVGTFANKPYYTADNLSFSGEGTAHGTVLFEERSGFNCVEVNDQELKVDTILVETDHKWLAEVVF